MKNNRSTALRMALIIVLALSLLLSGCGKKDPQETAESFLCAVRDGHTKKAQRMMHNPEAYAINDDTLELDRRLAAHLSWEFGDVDYDLENTYYTVHTTISMIDLSAVMEKLLNESFDAMISDAAFGVTWEDDTMKEQVAEALDEAIADPDAAMKTQEVELYLVPDGNGGWEVFVTDELTNALTGGVMEWVTFID